MSPVACDETDAVARIIGNAEVLARVRNALSLDNPDSRLKVEFNLLREAADGDWRRMQSSGEELTAGDSIAFEIINHEPRAVFISVLDFGVSGRIQLLYPPNARSELMEAEQTLKIGSGRRRIRLGLPDNFSGTHGVESFKLFVTSAETDFSWLQQAGARAPGTARSRLQHLFAAAYDGPTLRDAAMDVGEDESSDWRSMTRTFELRAG